MSENPLDPAASPAVEVVAETLPSPPAARPRKPFPGVLTAIMLLVVLFAVQMIAAVACAIVLAVAFGPQFYKESPALLAMTLVVSQIVSFPPVLWVGTLLAGRRWNETFRFHAFSPLALLPLLLAAAGISILTSECDNLFRFLLPIPDVFAEMFQELNEGGIAGVLALVVLAPLTEELLFRGLILQGFVPRYGPVKAVLLSALLFAIFHVNPYQFAPAMLTGVFLGWLFLRTGSLWPCIALHAFYNGLVVLLPFVPNLGIDIPGFTGQLQANVVQFQPLWFDALGAILVLAATFGVAMTTRQPATSPASA